MDDRNFHSGDNSEKAKTVVALIAALITMFFWGASAACFIAAGADPRLQYGDGFAMAAIAAAMTFVSSFALKGLK